MEAIGGYGTWGARRDWKQGLLRVVAAVAAWWSRTRSHRPAADTDRLKVMERLAVGPKKVLLIVACRGREYLVASGAEEISLLADLSSHGHQSNLQPRRLPKTAFCGKPRGRRP